MNQEQTVMEKQGSRAAVAEAVESRSEAGKYLTFTLGREEYGLKILKVREIIGLMKITAVPRTPEYIRGVINLRGKVIPVVDLRVKFGMEHVEETDESCIIVVEVMKNDEAVPMGVLIDAVSEVFDVGGEQIEDPPSFGKTVDAEFILGMAKIEEKVKILLNIQMVMTAGDFEELEEAVAGGDGESAE